MRLGVLIANAMVLSGVAWVALMGPGEQRVSPVLSESRGKPADLVALERDAATAPSVASTAALASAYLDREQPGLASAVLERAPLEVRERPEIAHLSARALFHRGYARQALAVSEYASEACARTGCAGWLMAATSRQVAFLGELVSAGIEDPMLNPVATRAAYDRSVREVRLVAMR